MTVAPTLSRPVIRMRDRPTRIAPSGSTRTRTERPELRNSSTLSPISATETFLPPAPRCAAFWISTRNSLVRGAAGRVGSDRSRRHRSGRAFPALSERWRECARDGRYLPAERRRPRGTVRLFGASHVGCNDDRKHRGIGTFRPSELRRIGGRISRSRQRLRGSTDSNIPGR